MTPRAEIFLIALVAFLVVLLFIVGRTYLLARGRSHSDLQDLLAQLSPLNRDHVALIARDLELSDDSEPEHEEPAAIWDLIGGLDGLHALSANCDVLIAIACSLQRSFPEALAVAEELRLNAREVKWHLGRIEGATRAGHLRTAFSEYGRQAIGTYYLMTRKLLVLYEISDVPGFRELQAAL
ncbi:MAG: hypothetical protein ACRYFU_05940 [Janthinobacterium lividum]